MIRTIKVKSEEVNMRPQIKLERNKRESRKQKKIIKCWKEKNEKGE